MARIAIIGGGIAGLTAAYSLHRQHHITLFEKSSKLGGNAFTFESKEGDRFDIAVAAFGKAGYKNFYALLDEIGVPTRRSRNTFMSFHDLDTHRGMHFSPNMRAIAEQGFEMFNPKTMISMMMLMLGLRKAQYLLADGALQGMTLDEALSLLPEFAGDARVVFLCALCLLSSMSAPEVLKTPAEFFFKKLGVHNDIISPKAPFSIHVASQGTQSYVNALADHFREGIVLNAKIEKVRRENGKVQLLEQGAQPLEFDEVIFACPAPAACSSVVCSASNTALV